MASLRELESKEVTLDITPKSKVGVKFGAIGITISYYYGDMSKPIKSITRFYNEIK